MNGKKILEIFIFLLIVLQVLGFVFQISFLNVYSKPSLFALIIILYFLICKRKELFHISIFLLYYVGEGIVVFAEVNVIKYQMILRVIVYTLLLFFLYRNHESFRYNRRDVLTIVLGSFLYTIIFSSVLIILIEPMDNLRYLGFFYLLLLYILLIVGAMHYINIRSERSLWFFLSILNFTFSDYIGLIDEFYLQSKELKVIMLVCQPLALVFLVNYIITKSLSLKSEEFEGF